MSPAVPDSFPLRRQRALALCLFLAASSLPVGSPVRAAPQPCGLLISVPKPPPVPFPAPKPVPVPWGGIGGAVGPVNLGYPGDVEVILYRCQGNAGSEVDRVWADALGRFAFGDLDAGTDYYVEATFPPLSSTQPSYRAGAYAIPGMLAITIPTP